MLLVNATASRDWNISGLREAELTRNSAPCGSNIDKPVA
jgi:hypothetical protein